MGRILGLGNRARSKLHLRWFLQRLEHNLQEVVLVEEAVIIIESWVRILRGSVYPLLYHELYPLYHEHGTHLFRLLTAPLKGLLMIILASTQMVYMIIKVKERHFGGARQDQIVLW